jgi:hypothetical protein
MKLDIDFDEFQDYVQNRENAKILIGADSVLMFPYRIYGDILFEKNKITISVTQPQGASPTYFFTRIKVQNKILVKFKPSKIFNINSIMFGVPSVLIILYLSFVSIPKPPPYTGESPLILKLFIASFLPFIWLMIFGSQYLQRQVLCDRTKKNWSNLRKPKI